MDADARAFDELARHARIGDLRAIAREVMTRAAAPARPASERQETERADRLVETFAAERSLSRDDANTAYGNALDVLSRDPTDEPERALARALAAHAAADAPRGEAERTATELLWLAAHTPFDATGLLDRAFGDDAAELWSHVAERVRRFDAGAGSLTRGEALVAASALTSSRSSRAVELVERLAVDVSDPKVASVLRAGAERSMRLEGEWTPPPRGVTGVILLGVTGLSLVAHAARAFGRVALDYRRPAEVEISPDGGIRVRWRVEILGRTLRDREVLVPRPALGRVVREVRYPRAALYAGLLALIVGTYWGVRMVTDGARAGSPSLIGIGLAIAAVGFALDLAFSSVAPGAQGRCRLVILPRRGRALCVGALAIPDADAMLSRLGRA